jgi:hypothetical protein
MDTGIAGTLPFDSHCLYSALLDMASGNVSVGYAIASDSIASNS